MCEIQFLKRTDGKNLDEKDVNTFVKFMSLGDLGNSEAFGFFNSKKDFKLPGKFDYKKLNPQDIISDNFIIGHNRFATKKIYSFEEEADVKDKENNDAGIPHGFISYNEMYGMSPFSGFFPNKICFVKDDSKDKSKGKSKNKIKEKLEDNKPIFNFNDNLNNHPFKLNELVLVHNGVVQNAEELIKEFKIKTEISTDSFIILFLIDKFLKEAELKDKSRGKKRDRKLLMVDAIRKTTNLIKGFYSVFLFDRKEKELYYFRDNIGSFYFYKPNKNMLIGSTNFENFEYVYDNKEIFKDLIIPKPGMAYLIKDEKGKKNPLQEIGMFKEYIKKAKKKTKKSQQVATKEKKQTYFMFLKERFIKLKGGKDKK